MYTETYTFGCRAACKESRGIHIYTNKHIYVTYVCECIYSDSWAKGGEKKFKLSDMSWVQIERMRDSSRLFCGQSSVHNFSLMRIVTSTPAALSISFFYPLSPALSPHLATSVWRTLFSWTGLCHLTHFVLVTLRQIPVSRCTKWSSNSSSYEVHENVPPPFKQYKNQGIASKLVQSHFGSLPSEELNSGIESLIQQGFDPAWWGLNQLPPLHHHPIITTI